MIRPKGFRGITGGIDGIQAGTIFPLFNVRTAMPGDIPLSLKAAPNAPVTSNKVDVNRSKDKSKDG